MPKCNSSESRLDTRIERRPYEFSFSPRSLSNDQRSDCACPACRGKPSGETCRRWSKGALLECVNQSDESPISIAVATLGRPCKAQRREGANARLEDKA